uniref:Dirigent protein n=1 Tax=Ananas comosus var. bracteatus TaxID=296719 RepID=A0A6V7P1W1_ANACO|nr:unnamed protein product [Ananas comosus var. bracteatus]
MPPPPPPLALPLRCRRCRCVYYKSRHRDDNMTHLHFYMHDILGGSNPTAIEIVKGPVALSSVPESTSRGVRSGRDPIAAPVRELSVVGGTGQFRMARGYVLWKTYDGNATNGDGVLELDVYVTTE